MKKCNRFNLYLIPLFLIFMGAVAMAQTVQVNIPDTTAANGDTIQIPIVVDDVTGLNIFAYQTVFTYNSAVLLAINATSTGTISQTWGPPTANLTNPGTVNVGGFGTAPLSGSGALVYLEFEVVGAAGDTTNLNFQSFLLNAGTPASNTTNGVFTVTGGVTVPVSVPDTMGTNGQEVMVPIRVGDLSGLDVFAYQTVLTFDQAVLNALGAESTGSLTESWGPPTVNTTTPGEISLGGFGTSALTGAGDLVYVRFSVVGSASDTTTIKFQSFLFNAGNPASTTTNGLFTVVAGMVNITVDTAPTGLSVEVDGTSYTAPHVFTWTTGDMHQLNALSPQSGGTGINYTFNSWSNGGTQSQNITVPAMYSTFTASYDTYFELTLGIDPAGSGTVQTTPDTSWFMSGTDVKLEAMANTGFVFNNWSGDLTGNGNPDTLTMDAPKDATAHFMMSVTVDVSIPDTAGEPSMEMYIPIRVTDLTGLDVFAYQTVLNFDNSVLNALGADESGSLTAPWGPPTVNTTNPGEISLGGFGTSALAGAGDLVYLRFSVVGNVGDTTTIKFQSFLFNAGDPVAATFNGLFTIAIVGVDDGLLSQTPTEFALYQNYPNPFNPATKIVYSLPRQSHVRLEVFNSIGQKVATLVNGEKPIGQHLVEWNAEDLSSGVYLIRLQAEDFVSIRKMSLMR